MARYRHLTYIRDIAHQWEENFSFKQRNVPDGHGACRTHGPRDARYAPTSPMLLLDHLWLVDRVKEIKPDFSAAVLGAGFGLSAFALATCVKKVVAFEIDPAVAEIASKTRSAFKPDFDNVEFRTEDFIHANLNPFDLVYFYMPFIENFEKVMGEPLVFLRPGTIAVSRIFYMPEHYPFPGCFRPLVPDRWLTTAEERSKHRFYSHEKTKLTFFEYLKTSS